MDFFTPSFLKTLCSNHNFADTLKNNVIFYLTFFPLIYAFNAIFVDKYINKSIKNDMTAVNFLLTLHYDCIYISDKVENKNFNSKIERTRELNHSSSKF